MTLKYKILWIENEEDWVYSIEDQIQEFLEELGFVYEKTLISKEDVGIDYNDFDLILMDLNLADQPNGAELISKIRRLGVYTDVVFYSARIDELKNHGKEKELEGVYYSGRTPSRDFVTKVQNVIESTIRKVQDLANLRGLVMAEVSELDYMMEDIIIKYFTDSAGNPIPDREAIFNELMDKFEVDLKNNLKKPDSNCSKKCSHKIRSKSIPEIVGSIFFESYKKARTISRILEVENIVFENFLNSYKSEILDIRNQLAHCASKSIDGKEILTTKQGEKTFNDSEIKAIRKNILKYSFFFTSLL